MNVTCVTHGFSPCPSHQVTVVQTSPTQMAIDLFSSSRHHDVKTDIQIKQACNTKVRLKDLVT